MVYDSRKNFRLTMADKIASRTSGISALPIMPLEEFAGNSPPFVLPVHDDHGNTVELRCQSLALAADAAGSHT